MLIKHQMVKKVSYRTIVQYLSGNREEKENIHQRSKIINKCVYYVLPGSLGSVHN